MTDRLPAEDVKALLDGFRAWCDVDRAVAAGAESEEGSRV